MLSADAASFFAAVAVFLPSFSSSLSAAAAVVVVMALDSGASSSSQLLTTTIFPRLPFSLLSGHNIKWASLLNPTMAKGIVFSASAASASAAKTERGRQ